MFERVNMKQLNDHIWLMDDHHEATGYLIVGKEKAMVIDTMNGYENIMDIVRTITDLPVVVVNTHGHCDHIFGNWAFDNAHLHPDDFALANSHFHFPEFMENCEKHSLTMPTFSPVSDGDIFDIGGLTFQVVALPEHTPGGICLLLKEDRILFTGDGINHHLWMQLDESLSIRELMNNLDKIMWVKEYADRILHGHAQGFDDISLIDALREGARDLLDQAAAGTLNDPDYQWFMRTDKQHAFGNDGSVICYRANNIEPGK